MSDVFGSARTATQAELNNRVEETGGGDIYLGRYYDTDRERAGDAVLYEGDRHLLVFGPTGSGKSTRFLIPNLLLGLNEQSVIVIDPKGELAAITADHRRAIGHRVVILNPFGVRGLESAGFNPLAGLDPKADTFYDDAAAIGEALIKVEGNDPHWSESAQGLIVALLMWEKRQRGAAANLENVRAMLTEPDKTETATTKEGKDFQRPVKGLRVTAALMADQGGFAIGSLAARFTGDTNELSSIKSTADTQTRWLLSTRMGEDLKKDGIDFASLKKQPTTVYVILPAERLRTHNVWLRLVIVSALRALYKPGGRRTVMLIDEMAALGHLAPLEDAFGLVRGYNIQIAAVLQDLGQLKALYKERWETFIANAGVVFGFAPNDLTTAEWMSKRSGQMTVSAKGFSESSNQSIGNKVSTSSGSGLSVQQVGRALFLPHELIGVGEGMGLLWLAGLEHSVRFFAPYYRKIKDCVERATEP